MIVSRFNNMNNEQLIAFIEDCVSDGLSRQEDICRALTEMKRRKQKHKYHKHPLYKWFAEVDSGKLLMGIVALWNGNKQYLNHLVGRPIELQKSILAENEMEVAFYDRKAQTIVTSRKIAKALDVKTFQRVFPIGKPPTTIIEQRKLIESERAGKPVAPTKTRHGPIVRADAARRVLLVGSQEVPLTAIRTALAEIGLQIVAAPQDDLLA